MLQCTLYNNRFTILLCKPTLYSMHMLYNVTIYALQCKPSISLTVSLKYAAKIRFLGILAANRVNGKLNCH